MAASNYAKLNQCRMEIMNASTALRELGAVKLAAECQAAAIAVMSHAMDMSIEEGGKDFCREDISIPELNNIESLIGEYHG